MQISRPGIGRRVGFEQHRLLVEAAGADADDGLAVAVMVGAELRELLSRDEEGRLAVRHALLRLRQRQRCLAHVVEGIAHRRTNSLSTLG